MSTTLLFAVAALGSFAALLLALHLRRYRLRWQWSLWNREFHRRTNYTAAGRPWLLAFEISAVVAWLAWVVLLMRR